MNFMYITTYFLYWNFDEKSWFLITFYKWKLKPHLRNWSIIIKLIVHRCSFNIFFSICHADSENVIKNSVSSWTPGQGPEAEICPNLKSLADFLAGVPPALWGSSRCRIFNYIFRICMTNGEKMLKCRQFSLWEY